MLGEIAVLKVLRGNFRVLRPRDYFTIRVDFAKLSASFCAFFSVRSGEDKRVLGVGVSY